MQCHSVTLMFISVTFDSAIPKWFLLPYLKHISLITKIYVLLQLIIICFLPSCAVFIDSYTSINKFDSFITFC